MFTGKLTRTTDTYHRSRLYASASRRVPGITPRCPDIHTADVCAHRTLKSKADLEEVSRQRRRRSTSFTTTTTRASI